MVKYFGNVCAGVNGMTTEGTIQGYFNSLKEKKGWESFLSDDMIFTSFTSPVKQVTGKDAYLVSTKRFYSMIVSVEVKDLVVAGEKACALTRYELQPPTGNTFISDVAEIFRVKDGKIDSFAIYFDSAPFPK
jgi:ketosteroid isomerase-like protein